MTCSPRQREPETGEEGYLLLGLVVVCFLLLLTLAIAAPRVAKQLERDREVESEHRAQEYVRAIQLFYRRTRRFPSSVEELLGKGAGGMSTALQVKYLRQQYKDPLTNGDYRLILVGKAKTEVKGFFGEPLEGAPIGNLGAAAGMQSSPGFGGSTSATGTPAGSSSGFSLGNSSSNSQLVAAMGGATAASPSSAASANGTSTGGSTFGSGTDASSFQGSKGAFLGVGSNAKGHGLVEWNGSENIEEWEFLYDPRVEAMKLKVSLFGGTPAANGTGSLGSAMSGSTGVNGSSTFGSGSSFGGANGSAFGGGTGTTGSGSSSMQSGFGFSTSASQTQGSATTGNTTDPNTTTPAR